MMRHTVWRALIGATLISSPALAYQGTPDWSSLYQSPTTGIWSAVGSTPAYFVATNGNDTAAGTYLAPFATLGECQTAMRASASNKTCFIRAGTYSPSPITKAGVTYALYLTQADNGETWSVYPPDGYDTAIIDGGSTATANGINEGITIEGGSNITIDGLQVQRFGWLGIGIHGGSGQYAVFAQTAPYAYNNTIQNNIVHDIHGFSGGSFGYAGITCAYASALNSVCANNAVYNTDTDGIRANTAGLGLGGIMTGLQITNNVVFKALNSAYTDGGCIYLQDNGQTSTNLLVANNMIHDCGTGVADSSRGIYLDDGTSNVTIVGNVIGGIFGWAINYHEGYNDVSIGNIIDLATSGSQYQLSQQQSNNTEGDMRGDLYANNLIISKTSSLSGGYYAGAGNPIVNIAWVNTNSYWSYGAGAISTTCVGNTGNGCPSDANPVTNKNPGLVGCYQLPSTAAQQVTASFFSYGGAFVASTYGQWGPPGYVLPMTGTAPSYGGATCW